MNVHYEKAIHLFRISRQVEAEKELRTALAEDPNDSVSRALLGLCLSLQGRPEEGIKEAEAAVHRAPNDPYCHFLRAQVLYNARRFPEALGATHEALRLNPHNADYFNILSLIHYAQSEWTKALEAAEMGLREDSEHVDCHIAKSKALTKLDRSQEAVSNVASAIRLEPERAETHAAQGWAYLEQNKTTEAMQCFREALRIEPNMEWARLGILHAMKARNPVYGLFLRYLLWMSKKKEKFQWGFVLGAYLLVQMVRIAGEHYPAFEPYAMPVLVAYIAFVIFSWIAMPLFNLILRLDKVGRMVLNEDETKASNIIGLLLAACIVLFIVYGVRNVEIWLNLGFYCVLLLIPVAGFFRFSPGPARQKPILVTGLLAIVGLGGAVLDGNLGSNLWMVYIVGVLLSSFLFNAMRTRR